MTNIVQFPWRPKRLTHQESRSAAESALAVSVAERARRADELRLEDPELLLCICEILRGRIETGPAPVKDDAEFFYGFLEKPARPIGAYDEREYFLGELALTAGMTNRALFRIADAKLWFQRAEASFALVQNANAHWARVAYQRLALTAEERHFDQVLQIAPLWAATFSRLEMKEDALKCRFLEGTAYGELGETRKAIDTYVGILNEARKIGYARLAALALNNLARFHADLGEVEEALSYARRALPVLQETGNQVVLVKLQWTTAELLRRQGQRGQALKAYREALSGASGLGMRGDVVALHLVVADLLLEAGQEAQAEWEIRAALPIIDEEKMVPEGIAALSLLRDSLRRRQIDKQALRDLHGYFQEN